MIGLKKCGWYVLDATLFMQQISKKIIMWLLGGIIDIDELADLLIKNYDSADTETKAFIPLIKFTGLHNMCITKKIREKGIV